jgi:glycosyltransferase involved in cell wall biosynthesis
MGEIALGVKMFSRVGRLRDLLASVADTPIETVYVADDGPDIEEKTQLYESEFEFDLDVIRSPLNSGVGHGRNSIVEASDEEYLLMVDSDNLIPSNVGVLREVLESDANIGGVCGLLSEGNRVTGSCHHMYREGSTLVRDVDTGTRPRVTGGHSIIEFDFLQNVTLFRRECLESYSWDERYDMGFAHADFYVGHHRQTDWRFAVCPDVIFPHRPGGDSYYQGNRYSTEKLRSSEREFKEKWNYTDIIWRDVYPDSYGHKPVVVYQYLFKHVPKSVHVAAWRAWKRLELRLRG